MVATDLTIEDRGNFSRWWVSGGPGEVVPLDDDDSQSWKRLVAPFRRDDPVLARIHSLALENGAICALVENRYIDIDFRNQHSRFYSTTFERHPTVCLRVHFFTKKVMADLSNLNDLRESYCGYTILRPLAAAPVGRTMIALPPSLREVRSVVCHATEEVNVFGFQFEVTAMPFISQDTQYNRCAHASLWMVLFHAHLHHGQPRRLPSDIVDAASGGTAMGRQMPSDGLSISQMLTAMNNLGLSPSLLQLPQTRKESDDAAERGRTVSDNEVPSAPLGIYDILCRYVNSQIPPVVIDERHAWVVIGYAHRSSPGHPRLTLIVHDDAHGPYLLIDDPWNDARAWLAAMPPLVPKLYLSAERAEALGEFWLRAYMATAATGDSMLDTSGRDDLRFRTYAIRSITYKTLAIDRLPADVAQLFRLQQWPRYVWVVEAIDRQLRSLHKPCVLGEAVIDATASNSAEPWEWGLLALFAPSKTIVIEPDLHVPDVADRKSTGIIRSGCDLVRD